MDFILKGTFDWAAKQAKEGHRVHMTDFDYPWFLEGDKHDLWFKSKENPEKLMPVQNISHEQLEATCWEIYEEPRRTLWSKRHYKEVYKCGMSYHVFHEEDVGEALKELLCAVSSGNGDESYSTHGFIKEKVKEIFGRELLGDEFSNEELVK